MNLTTILDDCLQRLAAGESVAQCLARYPEVAPELAPMLSAAEQLRAFSAVRLSQGQRLRAKVALREELAAQGTRRSLAGSSLGIRWPRWGFAPLAVLLAVVLFSTVAFSAVAASQPGDLVYPVRIAAERAPVWFNFSAERRVSAELALAERRLQEIARQGEAHQITLDALLRNDAEAVERAGALSESARAEVAERIAKHADELARMAGQSSDPVKSAALARAARDTQALAARLTDVVAQPPSSPAAIASLTPSRTPPPLASPLPVVVPTLSLTPPAASLPTPVLPGAPPTPPVPTVVLPTIPTVPTVIVPTVQTTVLPATGTPIPSPQPSATRTDITPRKTQTRFPTWTPWPTVVIPPTVYVPTVIVPTVVVPPIPTVRPLPTGAATLAVETPTPRATISPTATVPTVIAPTGVVPTIGPPPTIRPPGAQLTATVVWLTMTPPPTPTPRPIIRLTVTLTVLPPRLTATPAATATPEAPLTETPRATATQEEGGTPPPTSEVLETAMPAGTPTAPPLPR